MQMKNDLDLATSSRLSVHMLPLLTLESQWIEFGETVSQIQGPGSFNLIRKSLSTSLSTN